MSDTEPNPEQLQVSADEMADVKRFLEQRRAAKAMSQPEQPPWVATIINRLVDFERRVMRAFSERE